LSTWEYETVEETITVISVASLGYLAVIQLVFFLPVADKQNRDIEIKSKRKRSTLQPNDAASCTLAFSAPPSASPPSSISLVK